MMDTVQMLLLCCGSILIGGVLIYLLFLKRKPDTHVTDQEEKKDQPSDQREVIATSSSSISGSKKQAKSKKRREAQLEFTHSWMVGALKGHSGPVLDINFSANGRFLASCADEAAKSSSSSKAKKQQQQPPPSPSGSNKSSSSSSSSSEQEPQRAILSRRQRKNRTRTRDHDDDRPPPSTSTRPTSSSTKQKHKNLLKVRQTKAKQPNKEAKASTKGTMANIMHQSLLTDCEEANYQSFAKPDSLASYSDASLTMMLRRYVLTCEEMTELGYPLEYSEYPGYVSITYQPPQSQRAQQNRANSQHERKLVSFNLDANAREFVPCTPTYSTWSMGDNSSFGSGEIDSGRGSSTGSSPEGSDLEQESSSDSDNGCKYVPEHSIERRCTRCSKAYYVNRDDGEYIHEDKCSYHWGKFRSSSGYQCCNGRDQWRGCVSAKGHVWTGVVVGQNGPYTDFVKTEPARHLQVDGNYGVYALDCEMCFTKRGLEVGRVTLVDLNGEVAYDAMVKPDAEVIDYNTRFSGLVAKDLVGARSLSTVQAELKRFIYAETILVGHGLENDLRALKLLHPTVIDTTIWYPHYRGLPYRNSLKNLALTYLGQEIQQGAHDPAEDARIALNLVYSKLNEHLPAETSEYTEISYYV